MKLNTKINLSALCISLLFIQGCISDIDKDEFAVLAEVDNQSITITEALDQIPEIALRTDTLQAIISFKQNWINSRVLENEARRLKLQNNEAFIKRLNRLEQQLLEEMLMEHVLAEHEDELAVSRDEAQNYFQLHKDKFELEEKYVRYRHLTTNTRAGIDNARRDLMGGVSWEDVVNRYSVNPELQLRESEQFWPYSMATADIPLLNRYLGIIGLSEISPVHSFNGQYHFVQLREVRNEGDHPDFEWLIPQIREWLKLEKSQRITNAFKRNLTLQAESNNDIQQLSEDDLRTTIKDFKSTSEYN